MQAQMGNVTINQTLKPYMDRPSEHSSSAVGPCHINIAKENIGLHL